MPSKPKILGRADGSTVEVVKCEVVREPSSPTGFVARGVTPAGSLVRVPVPGATLDGVPCEVPSPDVQRATAPESVPAIPGEPKPTDVAAATLPPASPTAAAPRRAGKSGQRT